MLLWRSGLRCGEALALMPKDVDLEGGRIAVLHGKGDRARIVGIDPAACAVIEIWARERRQLGLTGRQPFFCVVAEPTRGLPVQSAYVRDLLRDLALKAGVDKRVHAHGLRHTYASYLIEHGAPIHHIRRSLGHSSLAVTERYADHLNPVEVVDRMRSIEWPEPPSAA
jgi:site-specific recombinase XerD